MNAQSVDLENLVLLIQAIVHRARVIVRKHWSPFGLKAYYKEGNNLAQRVITKIDVEVNGFLVEWFTKNFPDDGIRSEECHPINPQAPRQWLIDTARHPRGINLDCPH